ncbi:MAG: hypothetical protein GTO14_21955 [Anaerolineales bacterium]|nr:hypothetical protein [Anaerolineales bacterium]
MSLISFLNTLLAPLLGLLIGRLLTREQAYRLGHWIADRIAARKNSALVRAVRSNQAIVRGLPYDSPELDGAIREVFRTAARGYADWFRVTTIGPEAVQSSIEIDPQMIEEMKRTLQDGRGLMIAGAHMSSFNILLLALGVRGYPIQALSLANVKGGVHVDNAIRRRFGLYLTPVSVESLREAVDRLETGGIVMTGVDRPGVGGEEMTFFGRSTKLPIGHARLALRTNARILVGRTRTLGPGRYLVETSALIEPVSTGNLHRDAVNLAQQILTVLEDYIRAQPGEWLMFFPVWSQEMPTQPE